tara:strand:- start:3373 stop:4482 length:1110 start_codon:yes stop_codon:yes gene_type:complete
MSFFCPEPYKNLSAKTTGDWYPCCISGEESVHYHNMNIRENKILEFYHSDFMNKLRKDQLDGNMSEEVLTNCKKCIIDERLGRRSRRLKMIDKYKNDNFDILQLDSIKIKHIGNLCNAKCLTCAPSISSYLAQELYDTGEYTGPIVIFDDITKTYLEGIKEAIPFLNSIRIVGGEPIINPRTWEFVEWLVNNKATDTQLIFTTNGKVKFKKEHILLLKNFKEIKIAVSIDAYGKRNNYIRYPSPYEKVIENINSYLELTKNIYISTCISALNVGYLDELEKDISKKFPNIPWVNDNIVQFPEIFRPEILPEEIKISYLKSSKNANKFLSLDIPSDNKKFYDMLRFLTKKDIIRNTNMYEFYPEFKKYEL